MQKVHLEYDGKAVCGFRSDKVDYKFTRTIQNCTCKLCRKFFDYAFRDYQGGMGKFSPDDIVKIVVRFREKFLARKNKRVHLSNDDGKPFCRADKATSGSVIISSWKGEVTCKQCDRLVYRRRYE